MWLLSFESPQDIWSFFHHVLHYWVIINLNPLIMFVGIFLLLFCWLILHWGLYIGCSSLYNMRHSLCFQVLYSERFVLFLSLFSLYRLTSEFLFVQYMLLLFRLFIQHHTQILCCVNILHFQLININPHWIYFPVGEVDVNWLSSLSSYPVHILHHVVHAHTSGIEHWGNR